MASSSAAEPGARLSDRSTLPARFPSARFCPGCLGPDLVCGAFSCAARRSPLGLRAMVLLMHVVFVGAVFLLDSTLDRRIHEEPWYISHLIFADHFYFCIVLIFLLGSIKMLCRFVWRSKLGSSFSYHSNDCFPCFKTI